MPIKKSDQSYKVVKARTPKAPTPKVFDGMTFYRLTGFNSLPAAKRYASKHVRQHNMVRILDLGKKWGTGPVKYRYYIYSRSIPYSVYSKW